MNDLKQFIDIIKYEFSLFLEKKSLNKVVTIIINKRIKNELIKKYFSDLNQSRYINFNRFITVKKLKRYLTSRGDNSAKKITSIEIKLCRQKTSKIVKRNLKVIISKEPISICIRIRKSIDDLITNDSFDSLINYRNNI